MKSLKAYFKRWDFTRYFRLGISLVLIFGYFATSESMYLFGSLFFAVQAVFNVGCMGGNCSTHVPVKEDKKVMEIETYTPSKEKNNA